MLKVKKHLRKMKLPGHFVSRQWVENRSHSDENTLRNGDIIAKFLPPKATALIQLVDQGILEILKRPYRFHLL